VPSPGPRAAPNVPALAAHQASWRTPITGGGTVNWSTDGCRNVIESSSNQDTVLGVGFIVRLYYSPNESGARTWVPVGKAISNLNSSNYTFNGGTSTTSR
jgi:hypothetical protein